MKGYELVIAFFVVVLSSKAFGRYVDPVITGYAPANLVSNATLNDLFNSWSVQYKRSYNSSEEREKRFEVFKDNVHHIEQRNQQVTYFLGLNEFSDLTNKEFRTRYTGYKSPPNLGNTSFRYGGANYSTLPHSVNWVDRGAIIRVKDQGDCGSCWAFATVAAVESLHQITKGNQISFSEQDLLDCDSMDNGCNGGTLIYPYDYIRDNGLAREENYLYEATQGTCKQGNKQNNLISGYELVPEDDYKAIKKAVAHQPVSIAIEGSGQDFQLYVSGIFTGDCGMDLDHAVLVVGYGSTSDNVSYWTLKNSWGTSWGESGYMKIRRLTRSTKGLCGMYSEATYPISN